jgi:hypothetical protein
VGEAAATKAASDDPWRLVSLGLGGFC